jgi:type IV pilus assembly protein PilC
MAEHGKYNIYEWIGINKVGMEAKGMIPAESDGIAMAQLVAQGIEIRSLKMKPRWMVHGKLKAPKSGEIVVLMQQLSTMIGAGIPLVSGLEIIANGADKMSVKLMIMNVYRDVSSGIKFAVALARYPKQFNKLVTSLIAAGEESGTLDVILNQIANYLERMETLRSRVKKAMYYPVIMLVVTSVVATLLLGFIVPQFEKLFTSFGSQLPLPTRIVVGLGRGLTHYWYLIIAVIVGSIYSFIKAKQKSEKFRYFLDKASLRMPIFGELIKKAILARVCRTLSITLGAGISLVDGLKGVSEVANNRIYRDALLKVREDVISGKQFFLSLSGTGLFPSMMLQMIGIGEKAGALEKMLAKLADFLDEAVSAMVDGLSTLLEPVMLVVLGLLIGGFVVAMYLPIFRIGTVL